MSVAIGYKTKEGWTSEGWWNVPSKGCNTLLPGPLGVRYVYIYARDVNGDEWDGMWPMCTRRQKFVILGTQDCVARGYERAGFYEVDTKQWRSWTIQLTEPTKKGAPAR